MSSSCSSSSCCTHGALSIGFTGSNTQMLEQNTCNIVKTESVAQSFLQRHPWYASLALGATTAAVAIPFFGPGTVAALGVGATALTKLALSKIYSSSCLSLPSSLTPLSGSSNSSLSREERINFSTLHDLYENLQSQIAKHFSASKEHQKRLLIIVGEDHFEKKSLLIELMILDIINKFGFRDLLTETTNDLLQDMLNNLNSKSIVNILFVLKFAKKLGFKIHSNDPKQFNPNVEIRTRSMIQSLIESNSDGVFIVGALHLSDICHDESIRRVYDVLSINANNTGKEEREFLSITPNCPIQKLDFALNPSNATQIIVPGNSDLYDLDFENMQELIIKIKGYDKASSSCQEESPQIKSFNERLKKYPMDISTRLERADIFYKQNQKFKALQDYNFVLSKYPKNLEAQLGIQKCT